MGPKVVKWTTEHLGDLLNAIGAGGVGGGIGRLFQHLGRYHVPYFNHRYRCTDTLLERRYRASARGRANGIVAPRPKGGDRRPKTCRKSIY